MGGGVAAPGQNLDDLRVKDDEIVWRLIDPKYYVEDPANPGQRVIAIGTFSHTKKGVSMIREVLLRQQAPDPIAFIKQRFPKWGIAALKAVDVRKEAGCIFAIEPDPLYAWPPDGHVCIYKAPLKNRMKTWQCDKLRELAERNLILIPTV
jgi:hypothetical protein